MSHPSDCYNSTKGGLDALNSLNVDKIMRELESKMLVEYVRDEDGQMVGTVVAVPYELPAFKTDYVVGWSACRPNEQFNKAFGKKVAKGRALKGSAVPVPEHIKPIITKMHERADKYFK